MVNEATPRLMSMTGYASVTGQADGYSWVLELRAVNARGLDLRMRLPDWIEGLDPKVRAALKGRVTRGNLTLGLRISRESDASQPIVNKDALANILGLIQQVEGAAKEGAGVHLAACTAFDVLSQKGVLEQSGQVDTGPLCAALVADLAPLIDSFNAMRATEGTSLWQVLSDQIDTIETLTSEAESAARTRQEQWADTVRSNLDKALGSLGSADPDRVAQELALLTVKADVTEELDRLTAHVATARSLLSSGEPVGRKLDFLTQEFNREANTLCSKSQSKELTAIGLDLKVVIDQMREQVQNVE